MIAALRILGADADAVLGTVGLTAGDMEDPDARVPFETSIELAAEAARTMGDPAFGLHVAELYQPGVFGVLDYLAHSSRTLGEAVRHLCRYNRLLQDAAETLLTVDGGQAVIWQRLLGSVWMPPGVTEHSMANLVVIGRNLTGTELAPLEVRFRHARPDYAPELERVFRTKIRFEAEQDAVVLAAEHLDLPLTNADPNLCSILDRHAQKLLDELPRVARFSARLRELVAAELRNGTPTADEVAAKLSMSERTLRRRLAEDGTSYEGLLDELRRALTEHYLDSPELSLEQIALMIGYSEASAFRRAFRRWYGTSPASYRKQRKFGGPGA